MLADRGYDVWLGNYRGGMYARRHVNMTDQDAAFWDFRSATNVCTYTHRETLPSLVVYFGVRSLDDIGRLDVPALLQEVLARTGRRSVAYIGHSMGASVLAVMASSQAGPRLLDHISRAYMLAPAAYMGHASQPAVSGSAGAIATLHVCMPALRNFTSSSVPSFRPDLLFFNSFT